MDQKTNTIRENLNLETPFPFMREADMIMNQASDDITMTDESEALVLTGAKGNSLMEDEISEGVSMTENVAGDCGRDTEKVGEEMDLDASYAPAKEDGKILKRVTEDTEISKETEEGIEELRAFHRHATETTSEEKNLGTPSSFLKEADMTIDQASDDINMTSESQAFVLSGTEGNNLIMDQTTEGFGVTETAATDSGQNIGKIVEEMDLEGPYAPDKEESIALDQITQDTEISNQSVEESNVFPQHTTETITAKVNLGVPFSLVKEGDMIMDQATDGIGMAGELEAFVSTGSEENILIMDLINEGIKINENVATDFERNTEKVAEEMDLEAPFVPAKEDSEIPDQVNEDIETAKRTERSIEELKNFPRNSTETIIGSLDLEASSTSLEGVRDVEGIVRIINKQTECVNVTKDFKATSLLSAEEGWKNQIEITNTPYQKRKTIRENENVQLKTLDAGSEKLEIASTLKKRKRKRKAPPVSEMVMNSVKFIKRSDGVSFEDIKNYMEDNYPVNVKALLKYHVTNFLKKCVNDGMLEKSCKPGAEERFRIKEK